MKEYQKKFIEFCIRNKVLKFGEFELKSGRISPYFFNMGLFGEGKEMAEIGEFYSAALLDSGIGYDVLFGPAYKGIPLVVSLSINLYSKHGKSVKYSFNRKEKKDHGEKGIIIGSELKGDVVVIDDVITAGTAIREAFEIISNHNSNLTGVLIALDREEKGKDTDKSAIQQVKADYNVPVVSIIKLSDIIEYLSEFATGTNNKSHLESIQEYRSKWGC